MRCDFKMGHVFCPTTADSLLYPGSLKKLAKEIIACISFSMTEIRDKEFG